MDNIKGINTEFAKTIMVTDDNVATYGTNNLSKFVSKTVKNIFIPLLVWNKEH